MRIGLTVSQELYNGILGKGKKVTRNGRRTDRGLDIDLSLDVSAVVQPNLIRVSSCKFAATVDALLRRKVSTSPSLSSGTE